MGYRRGPFAIVGEFNQEGRLLPVALAEYGFRPENKQAFRGIVHQLHTVERKGIQWIEPRLTANVKFLERSSSGKFRIKFRIPPFLKFVV